jgi:DNA-binding GntR family transcriptional regulator
MSNDQSSRKGNVVDRIVQSLSDDIVSGRLVPGTKLDAQGMAERFGVSRTPISAMGLVTHRPNRGVIVSTMMPEALSDLYEAMAELESALARLATLRMSRGQWERLQQIHRDSVHLVRDGGTDAYARFNQEFHDLIFEAAQSSQLQGLAVATRARLAPFRRAQFKVSNRISRSWEEHDAIVRAILAGDADTVGRLMRLHVQTVSAISAEFVAEHRAAGAASAKGSGRS